MAFANIEELHAATVEKYGKAIEAPGPKRILPCKQRHVHSKACSHKYLAAHPIFELLGGIPLVISIVAPFAVERSLTEIFLYLADRDAEKKGQDLNSRLQDRIEGSALIDSLEYCTHHFTARGRRLLELWYMIGAQGPGILNTDLAEIFEEEAACSHDAQCLDKAFSLKGVPSKSLDKPRPASDGGAEAVSKAADCGDKKEAAQKAPEKQAGDEKPTWENMTSE